MKISRACVFPPVGFVVLVLLLLPFQLDAQREETVVTALAIAPNGRTFYAGTASGEVFKTINTGRRWSLTGPGLHGSIRDLEVDPTRPTTVYAATTGGLFVTTDGGASWRTALPGLAGEAITVAADPSSPGVVYAGLNGPVLLVRSTDYGLTWTPAWTDLQGQVRGLAVHPTQPGVLFAATLTGMFRSETAGRTWFRAGLDGSILGEVIFDTLQPNRLYATRVVRALDGRMWIEVYVSHNSSQRWRLTGVFQGPSLVQLAADTRLPLTVYAAYVSPYPDTQESGLWKSQNAGRQWERLIEHSQVHSLATNPRTPGLLLAGFSRDHPDPGVIAMTRDGGLTWTPIGYGIMEGTLP